MHERIRRREGEQDQLAGEPPGLLREPFGDWDNPEDAAPEDEPEGYYDDNDDSYVPGPEDPDYDLSEAAGYAGWEAPSRSMLPGWLIAAGSILLILALVVPLLLAVR